MTVEIVRVYDDPGRTSEEYRILADRLWPRGINKAALDFDEWVKDVAPSTELRRWYGHDPGRYEEFARRYRNELRVQPVVNEVQRLRNIAAIKKLVVLTATRDVDISGARVLCDVLASLEG
ncbi:MAG: DUF488 family protein [Actinobacteria bacterium]|nr:DUF488 family protein [Actinomycetota bacterium]MCL5446992.1 DUF488 family protein [Actinomycetota bacterium]